MKRLSLAICLLLGSAVSFGQIDPLGSEKPLTYTIESLPNDLTAVELTTTKDNLMSLMQMSYSGGATISAPSGGHPVLDRDTLMQMLNVYWIPKEENLNGKGEFMLAYKLEFPMQRTLMVQVSSIRFRLTYVRRQSIISITPREDFSPTAIKELAKEPTPAVATGMDRTVTLSNLKQVALGTIMLGGDNNDYFPFVQSTPQLFQFIEPYTKNREILKTKNPMGGEFRFNMSLAGASMTSIEQPSGTPMYYESEAWPDGKRCIAYTDGHVKVISAEEWQRVQPFLKLKLQRKGKPIPPGGTIPPSGPNPKVK